MARGHSSERPVGHPEPPRSREPPRRRAALWLLRRLMGSRHSRAIQDDLAELFALRVRANGERWARRWYRGEIRRAVIGAVAHRLQDLGQRRVTQISDPHRGGSMLELWNDFRHGLRRVARAPGFTAAVVITLALGLGGATAGYSLVHGVLIAPLPYPQADRLVRIFTDFPGDREWSLSVADYLALAEQQTSFETVAAYDPTSFTVVTPEGAERVLGYGVTASFFDALGINMAMGRPIVAEDDAPGAPGVVVVSQAFFRSRLGGTADALGQTLVLNDASYTVVGVLPADVGPIEHGREVFTNVRLAPPPRKGPFILAAIGRIRADVDATVAATELRTINDRIFPLWQDSWPQRESTWGMRDLKHYMVGEAGTPLWIVLAAVGTLLLIASLNAANLLVGRGLDQSRDLAIRTALGASRKRLLGHLCAEGSVLAVAGAAAGMALAVGAVRLATTAGAPFIPRTNEIGFPPPVLVFAVAVTAGAFLIFGIGPAMHLSRRSAAGDLRSSSRSTTAGTGARTLRRVLVTLQFAITAPLLIGGGLLLASMAALRAADPGFDAERVLTVGLSLPPAAYREPAIRRAFWDRVRREVAALPGVEAVGVSDGRPPEEPGFGNNFLLEGRPLPPGESQPTVPWSIADAGYFTALGVRVLAGRMFDMNVDPSEVALVDETWARLYFDTPEAAVGRRFLHGGCTVPGECDWWSVIGVVEDVEYNGIAQADLGTMYLDAERYARLGAYLVVRVVGGEPAALIQPVRRILRAAEPTAPITDVATGEELMADSLAQSRYLTLLVSAFGVTALLLSLVGIYGVMAYFVRQHRREMGIRLALGAKQQAVIALVLRSGMYLVGVGTAIGVAASLLLTRLMEGVLFGVRPIDAGTFGAAAAALAGFAFLACWPPAWRAARVEPVETLRAE